MGWAARERVLRPSVQRIFDEASILIRLSENDLIQIPCPVLLIWGKRETVFEDDHRTWFEEGLYQRGSGVATRTFQPDSLGHVPHLAGDMVTIAISDFMHETLLAPNELSLSVPTTLLSSASVSASVSS